MKMNNLHFAWSAVAASLMLAGCSGDGEDHAIESNTYQKPFVVDCDDFMQMPLLAAESLIVDVQCELRDGAKRDLSASEFVFRFGAEERTGIAKRYDAETGMATFALATSNTAAGELPELCVTPQTHIGNHNQGESMCFVADQTITDFAAPVVKNLTELPEQVRIKNSVAAQYDVSDEANGDFARETIGQVNWYRSGSETSISQKMTLEIDEAWFGEMLHYCVKPIVTEAVGANLVGAEKCSQPVEILPLYREEKPSASVSVSFGEHTIEDGVVNTTPVLPATILSAQYNFEPGLDLELGDGSVSQEGESPAFWQRTPIASKTVAVSTIDASPQVMKQCNFSVESQCDYEVKADDLTYKVEFCVTPTTANQTTGEPVCAGTDVFGIQVGGTLEYLQTLSMDVYGYDLADGANSVTWYVDTASSVATDGLRMLADNTMPAIVSLHQGRQFEIATVQGLREALLATTVWEKGDVDATRRGGVSDWSWGKLIEDSTLGLSASSLDANAFIGKEVRACITMNTSADNVCFNISERTDIDASFYYTQEGVNGEKQKGISPVTLLAVAKDDTDQYWHHRPLTLAEGYDLVATEYYTNINGIDWAQFTQQTFPGGGYDSTPLGHQKDALLSCLNLNTAGHKWVMPVYDASVNLGIVSNVTELNVYENQGNMSLYSQSGDAMSNYDGVASLGFKIRPLTSSSASQLSAVTGWPLAGNAGAMHEQSRPDLDDPNKTRLFIAGYGSATIEKKSFTVGQTWSAIQKMPNESGAEPYIWVSGASTKGAVPIVSCVTKTALLN